jgi:predicted nucleotidyltransferase
MIALLHQKRNEIAELCRTFGIRKLEVFGSAATGSFDPETSDIDFIVDLGEYDDTVGARYMGLAAALEELFGRRVDLITTRSIRDPLFMSHVNTQRRTIYEARDREAAA